MNEWWEWEGYNGVDEEEGGGESMNINNNDWIWIK